MGKRLKLFKKLLISVAIAVPATAVGVISLFWSVHGPEPLVHVARVLLLPVLILAALFGDKALGFPFTPSMGNTALCMLLQLLYYFLVVFLVSLVLAKWKQ